MPEASLYFSNVGYKSLPAWSPVKGLPVLLAPCNPGARPTISMLESKLPKDCTGELCHFGSRILYLSLYFFNLGHKEQLLFGVIIRYKFSLLMFYNYNIIVMIYNKL